MSLPKPEELTAIGKVLKPHGIHGEMRTMFLTDFPERFDETDEVYLVSPKKKVLYFPVENTRYHAGCVLLKLRGIDTPEEAGEYRNWLVSVPDDELVELEEGEYWHFQLVGLKAMNEAGEVLGELCEVLETPGHDIYAIKTPEGKELLIPAVEAFVKKIDIEGGTITVCPPEF